jgi:pimeloyl-ACP methyl ester carboxylesterase
MASNESQARLHQVRMPDGRVLEVHEYGDPSGPPTIAHHGTPGSGARPTLAAEHAGVERIRLVMADRAGYGGSDRLAGRRVASVAADTEAVADALGIDRFCTWGVSGGGPHALACAALLPDRVIAAASLASVAPYDADGLEFTDGMCQENVEEFGASAAGEEELRQLLEPVHQQLIDATDEQILEVFDPSLADVDRLALRSGIVSGLRASIGHGLITRLDGWIDDDLAFVTGWGFDPTAIAVPLLLLHGAQDRLVPFAHGEWLRAALPEAEDWLSVDHGHISLVPRIGEVHQWLLAHS